jgi:hypothetical protein
VERGSAYALFGSDAGNLTRTGWFNSSDVAAGAVTGSAPNDSDEQSRLHGGAVGHHSVDIGVLIRSVVVDGEIADRDRLLIHRLGILHSTRTPPAHVILTSAALR